jgi:Rieske Fe-S protein
MRVSNCREPMKGQSGTAEGSDCSSTCMNRRSVLKSGAAGAVLAALSSEGCTTSEPLSTGSTGAGGDAGVSGEAGVRGDSGVSDAGVAGSTLDGGGNGGGRGGAGAGGGNGVADAGAVDTRGEGGGAGGAGRSSGTGGGVGGNGGGAGTSGSATCPGAVMAGKALTVALGSLVTIGNGLVLGRDAAGLYAMSAICTHQGCGMNVVGAASQQSLYCACHGSMFSGNGAVTRGPARRPLQHYQLEAAANGDLTVCVGTLATSTTRTAG